MTAIADTEHRNYDATVGQAHATKDHVRGWGVHAGRDKVCDTGLASCQGRESANGRNWTHRTPELQRGGRQATKNSTNMHDVWGDRTLRNKQKYL